MISAMRVGLLSILMGMLCVSTAGAMDAATLQNALEESFGILVLTKEHRSAQDRVTVSGNEQKGFTAEISYWRSLQSRDPADEICNAYKWLFFGRYTNNRGASDAFIQYPALQVIELRFFDVEFGTKLGKKKAEVLPTSHVIPYLKIGVERRSLQSKKVTWKDLKEEMSKGKCGDIGSRYVDSKWFDEAYLRQGRKGG